MDGKLLFLTLNLVSLVGMYWLVVESTCWIDCPSETSNSLEPFCYLNDDGTSSECSIYVSTSELHGLSNITDWYRIKLANNVTDNINNLSIVSGLPDSKLEITAFRPFNQITFLESHSSPIVSVPLLSFLPNLKRIYMINIRFNYIPYFAYYNRYLTYISLSNFGIRSNVTILGRRFVSQLTNLESLYIHSKS